MRNPTQLIISDYNSWSYHGTIKIHHYSDSDQFLLLFLLLRSYLISIFYCLISFHACLLWNKNWVPMNITFFLSSSNFFFLPRQSHQLLASTFLEIQSGILEREGERAAGFQNFKYGDLGEAENYENLWNDQLKGKHTLKVVQDPCMMILSSALSWV